MPSLFGTDGVRGIANADITVELAVALGRAGATILARQTGRRPRMLIGRDTRRSGDLLEAALSAGAMSVGADVLRLGVATTPAVAYLVRVLDVDAGAVISASHNPAAYNGIKFFSHDGYKLPDAAEAEIEAMIGRLAPAGSLGRGLWTTNGRTAADHAPGGSDGWAHGPVSAPPPAAHPGSGPGRDSGSPHPASSLAPSGRDVGPASPPIAPARRDSGSPHPAPIGPDLGSLDDRSRELARYIDFIAALAGDLSGLRIICDCANGAAYEIAPQALRQAGATVEAISASPDGLNINDDCGSLHPAGLARRVREAGADLGFAFDGDADRLIATDEHGEVVDGDQIMAMVGCDLLARGQLPGDAIVGTVMSNLGLELCLHQRGGRLLRTKVGDRHVLERLREGGYALGGEQSGHIIFLRHHTTGDGLLTAAVVAALMKRTGRPLSELAGIMPRLPQVLQNVRVAQGESWEANANISAAIMAAENALGDHGRVLVRASGTEPLLRVMVEGEDAAAVQAAAASITAVVTAELGVAQP